MAHANYGERVSDTAIRGLDMAGDLASNAAGVMASAGDTAQRMSREIWSRAGGVADDLGAAGRAGVSMAKRNSEVTALSICATVAIGYFAYLMLRPPVTPRKPLGHASGNRSRHRSSGKRSPR